MRRSIGPFVLALILAPCVATGAAAEPATPRDGASGTHAADWPQWRGPDRDGRAPGASFPESLAGLERVWRVELGKGYPGPIVAGDRVFVVESADDESVRVRALDRRTGTEIWSRTWASSGKVPFFAARNGDWVRSTPAWDGATLYVGDMREVLVALDGTDGTERWRVDLPGRFGTAIPDFGFASSPLVDDGSVYVQAANSIVKLDAKTGSTIWRALDGDGRITESGAFSSPVIAEVAGVRQLVVLTRLGLHGVAPDDGRVLWSQAVPNFRGMNILTPVVVDDAVFTSPYRERSFLYRVVRSSGTDGVPDRYAVETAWDVPGAGYMASPVVVDGHAYLLLGNGRLACFDLDTGRERWRTSESFGKYWSLATDGTRILALDETGDLILFAADPNAFRKLDVATVGEPESWGHLAVSGPHVFVRELEAVSMWRWDESPAPAPARTRLDVGPAIDRRPAVGRGARGSP